MNFNSLLPALLAAPWARPRPGLFFFGPAQTAVPFGNGVCCAAGLLIRLGVLFTGAAGGRPGLQHQRWKSR